MWLDAAGLGGTMEGEGVEGIAGVEMEAALGQRVGVREGERLGLSEGLEAVVKLEQVL